MRPGHCGAPALSRLFCGLRTHAFASIESQLRSTTLSCAASISTCVRGDGIIRHVSRRSVHSLSRSPSDGQTFSIPRWRSQFASPWLPKSSASLDSRARPEIAYRVYSTKGPQSAKFGDMTEEEYNNSPHRFKPLTREQVGKIFGPGLTKNHGNNLLETLQKQRVTGTLDHDVSGPGINKIQIGKALRWLRTNYSMDEDAAIMARIEREEEVTVKWRPNQGKGDSADPGDVYGESELEKRIREVKMENERWMQEERIRKNREEKEGQTHTGPRGVSRREDGTLASHGEGKSSTAEWVARYRKRAQLSDHEQAPEVNRMQVLGPTTLFTIVLVGSCIFFALNYTPPRQEARLYPDIPPAAATVIGIIALNTAVWAMWRMPPLWRLMNRYFILVPAMPNPLSMIGSVFSHHGLGHLASNMIGLWFIGTALCDEVGRGKFLAIYCASGILGNWLSLTRFVLTRQFTITTLGASGAVLGVIAAWCALYPNRFITIAFLPEDWRQLFAMRAEYVLYTLLAFEAFCVLRGKIGTVDHACHLGGLITGVAGAEALKRQARVRRQMLEEKRKRETVFGGFGGKP